MGNSVYFCNINFDHKTLSCITTTCSKWDLNDSCFTKKKNLVPKPFLISKFSFITTGDERKKILYCPSGLLLNHLQGLKMTLMLLLSGVTG